MDSKTALFAYDDSGSTNRESEYWMTVSNIHSSYLEKGFQLRYFAWNSIGTATDAQSLLQSIGLRRGNGGTQPEVVARYVIDHQYFGHLILITDGQCNPVLADEALTKAEHVFQKVDVYLISNSSYAEANMSVSCAFTRHSPHEVFGKVRGKPLHLEVSINSENIRRMVELLDTCVTKRDFMQHYSEMQSYVVAQTMGKSVQEKLRQKLLAMQKRIVRNMATEDEEDPLTAALIAGDIDAAHAAVVRLVKANDSETAATFQQNMQFLLRCTEGGLQTTFSIGQIQSNRAAAAASMELVPVDEALTLVSEGNPRFECPITLEEGEAVLFVRAGDPILQDLDKSEADAILNTPLCLLSPHHADTLDKLLNRLGHAYSLQAVKEAMELTDTFPFETDPLDRNPLSPVILALGAHASHAKVTDSALRELWTGGKAVGNLDLLFLVIAYAIEQGKVPFLEEHASRFRQHALWRLRNRKSYASLSGQATSITAMLPLGTAIWFVREGALRTSECLLGNEPLRMHLGSERVLLWAILLQGYPQCEDNERYIKGLKTMFHLRRKVCEDGSRLVWLQSACRALYQLSYSVEEPMTHLKEKQIVPFIPFSGPATEELVRRAMDWFAAFGYVCNDRLLLYNAARVVDPQLSSCAHLFQEAPLPGAEEVPNPNHYTHEVMILLATCRPRAFFADGHTWREERARNLVSVEGPVLSTSKWFMDFVVKYMKYPTKDEWLTFLYNRLVVCNPNPDRPLVLPLPLLHAYEEECLRFKEVMATLSPLDAVRRYKRSVPLAKRRMMELQAVSQMGTFIGDSL
jgi:hypothetical protein